jgi:hypothetical protein
MESRLACSVALRTSKRLFPDAVGAVSAITIAKLEDKYLLVKQISKGFLHYLKNIVYKLFKLTKKDN